MSMKKKSTDNRQHKHNNLEIDKTVFVDTFTNSLNEEVEVEIGEQTLEDNNISKINELEKLLAEQKDKYLRTMAEFDNYRKRTVQEKSDWIKLSNEKLALSICDVLDNFERAIAQLPEQQKEDNYIKGILLIEQQLRKVLEKEGIYKIDALGTEFDPACHEALVKISSEKNENIIVAIIQNGYKMHNKIIRPVRVAVSNGQAPEEKK